MFDRLCAKGSCRDSSRHFLGRAVLRKQAVAYFLLKLAGILIEPAALYHICNILYVHKGTF